MSEFSVENVLFFMEVEQLRHERSQYKADEEVQRGKRLFDKYLIIGEPSQRQVCCANVVFELLQMRRSK